MRFEVELDKRAVEPGDKVTGVARATAPQGSRSVSAQLVFEELAAGGDASEYGAGSWPVAQLDPVTLHEGDLAEGQELRFELEVPEGALRTYAGASARLAWYVDVTSDEPGLDSKGRAEVIVGPQASAGGAGGDFGTALTVT